MKQNYIEEKLRNQGLTIFTSLELKRATGLSPASIKHLLVRYIKKGIVLKLKDNRGLYCLKKKLPHPWLLANKLRHPSYISLETALAYYGAIPESVYGVTSVTPLLTQTFEALGTTFTYQKIKASAYMGYQALSIDGSTILIAEPEKAVADILYFVHTGRKKLNDRFRWSIFRKKSILTHLKSFKRKNLVEWANHVIPNNA